MDSDTCNLRQTSYIAQNRIKYSECTRNTQYAVRNTQYPVHNTSYHGQNRLPQRNHSQRHQLRLSASNSYKLYLQQKHSLGNRSRPHGLDLRIVLYYQILLMRSTKTKISF